MNFLLLWFASFTLATQCKLLLHVDLQPNSYIHLSFHSGDQLAFKVYPWVDSGSLFQISHTTDVSNQDYSFYLFSSASLLCIERNGSHSLQLPISSNQIYHIQLQDQLIFDSLTLNQFTSGGCFHSQFVPTSFELNLNEEDITPQIRSSSTFLYGESQVHQESCIPGYFYAKDACEPCDTGCAECDSQTCFRCFESQNCKTKPNTKPIDDRTLQQTGMCLSTCSECGTDYLCASCIEGILLHGACFSALEQTSGLAGFTQFDISSFLLQLQDLNTKLFAFDQSLTFPAPIIQIDDYILQLRGSSQFTIPYDHSSDPQYQVQLKISFATHPTPETFAILKMTSLLPGCSRLYYTPDIKECQICEQPYRKLANLCLKSKITPRAGVADITSFSLLDFKTEMQQLNQSLAKRDAPPIKVWDKFFATQLGSYIVFIDNRQLQTFRIPSRIANTYEFSVPVYIEIEKKKDSPQSFIYDQVNLAQPPELDPQDLETKINSSSIIPPPSEPIQDPDQPTPPPAPSNPCGCSQDGECDAVTRKCTCASNYGSRCQYPPQVYEELSELLSSILTELQDLKPYLTPQDSLQYVEVLSSNIDLLSSDGYKTMLNMLWEVSGDPLHSAEVFDVLSNMAESPEPTIQEDVRLLLNKEVQTISNPQEVVHINTNNFNVTVAPVVPSEQVSINDGQFEAPPDVLPEGHVVLIEFSYNPYSAISTPSKTWATGVTSIQHIANGRVSTITNLSKPFTIRHRLNSEANSDLKKWLDYASQSQDNKQRLLDQNPFICSFWKPGHTQVGPSSQSSSKSIDQATSQGQGDFSSAGCNFVDFSSSELICECHHMTDFMGFLKTGISVLQDSNYGVILAVTQLTWEGLKTNTGFLFTVGFFASYILLVVILSILDTHKLKKSFYEELFRSLNHREYSRKSSKRTLETNQVQMTFSSPRNQKSKSEDLHSHRSLTGAPNKRLSSIASISTVKVIPSRTSQIRKKYSDALKKKKNCCGKMASVTFTELKQNNMPYNLVATTSTLSPRAIRLTLFYLGIMIDVALCALFFNLEEEEDDPPFWDGIIQNFWVALYTILIAMPPLVIVGCFLGFGGKTKKVLQDANNVNELAQAYRKYRRRIRCREAFGFISFILITGFLALYIISFAHIATPLMARDWIESTLIGFVLDQVIFEIAPALIVALLALLSDCCNCKCTFILIVMIEIYRIYRNLTDA